MSYHPDIFSALRKQAGTALIVALLVVAMVTGLAVTVAKDFAVVMKRAENRLLAEQAYGYLLGAESLARRLVLEDLRIDDQEADGKVAEYVDSIDELWASTQPPFPVDGGWVSGRLQDMQGRFNINLLVAGGEERGGWTIHQARFIRLLQTLETVEIDLQLAERITAAIVDWLDTDNDPRPLGGLEAYAYSDSEPASGVANKPLVDISELRFVLPVNAAIYTALRPHIYALQELPPININTATLNVLRTLRGVPADKNKQFELDPLTEADVEQILEARAATFGSINDLKALPLFDGRNFDAADISVKTNYFIVFAQAELQARKHNLYSIISRQIETEPDKPKFSTRVIRHSRQEIYPFFETPET